MRAEGQHIRRLLRTISVATQLVRLLLFDLALLTLACDRSSQHGNLQELTTVEQVRNLAADEANAGYPVRTSGCLHLLSLTFECFDRARRNGWSLC